MNIKKYAAILLTAGLLLSLTACSNGNTESRQANSSASQAQSGASESQNASGSTPESISLGSQVFGKINSVAGNEITLSMAKPPEVEQEEGSSQAPQQEGEIIAAAEMVPATEAAQGGTGEAVQIPKIELTYTGEEQDFVIPAGASILGVDGTETDMTSLKKGSVIMLNLDGNGKVLSLSVWE